jgi:hypothetical protein
MLGVVVMGAAAPHAFGERGLFFAGAYLTNAPPGLAEPAHQREG